MSNDFEDRFDKADGGKGRSRARKGEQSPAGVPARRRRPLGDQESGDDYYLDDDFNGAEYDTAGEAVDSAPPQRRQERADSGAGEGGARQTSDGGNRPGRQPRAPQQPPRQPQQSAPQQAQQRQPQQSAPQQPQPRQPQQSTQQPSQPRQPQQSAQQQSQQPQPPRQPQSQQPRQSQSQPPQQSQRLSGANGTQSGRQPSGRTSDDDRLQVGDYGSELRQKRTPDSPAKTAAASRSAAKTAKAKKTKRIIILVIAEIIALTFIFAYAYVAKLMNSIQTPNFSKSNVANVVMTPKQKEHMTGYWTIAVFGVDSRDGNVNKGTNTDVIMLCNINRDTGEIKLVSVYRDTYLNVSSKNTYNKINSAYASGGPEQALAALNKNLDLNITEYVTFNWKAVADGINLLGGVDIDISKAEFRYINSFITETVEKTGVPSKHLKSAGTNHLDGVQAVAYGRLRLMDTDYARTERQRLIIEKSFAKAKTADLGLLNRILLTEFEQIGTNLTFSDFTQLILDIGKYRIGETAGFPTDHDDKNLGPKKGDCVIPQTLESNVVLLHEFLYDKVNYDTTDVVKKISAQIMADARSYKKGSTSSTKASTEESKKETTAADETESAHSSTKPGTTIEETDEDGNPVSTESEGTTKPGESKPGTSKPGETKPDATKPSGTKPEETIKPGETKPSETKPSGTKPSESASPGQNPSPGETTSPTEATGPGVTPTQPSPTPSPTTPSPEPTQAGPGGSGGNESSQPGGSDIPVVSAPPGAA